VLFGKLRSEVVFPMHQEDTRVSMSDQHGTPHVSPRWSFYAILAAIVFLCVGILLLLGSSGAALLILASGLGLVLTGRNRERAGRSDQHGAPRFSPQWVLQAVLVAALVFGGGILLLGLPGAVFLEVANSLGLLGKLPPDAAWPLAILITFVGAVMIVPVSLVLRYRRPDIAGWAHVWRTALLTLAGTFIFTILVAYFAAG
jgi:hypothetical protein